MTRFVRPVVAISAAVLLAGGIYAFAEAAPKTASTTTHASEGTKGGSMMGGSGGMMSGGMMSMMGGMNVSPIDRLLASADRLNLTDAQRDKLNALKTDTTKESIRLRSARDLVDTDLQTLISNPKSDLSAIQSKLDELAKTESSLRFAAIRSGRTARSVLTGKQWDTLAAEMPCAGTGSTADHAAHHPE
ncbi:hypothetical protein FJZ36_14885 [Candidatus Poribacteria bacterium]|nr:hypothetical protein [Candidatus Poribacteria bacterium]